MFKKRLLYTADRAFFRGCSQFDIAADRAKIKFALSQVYSAFNRFQGLFIYPGVDLLCLNCKLKHGLGPVTVGMDALCLCSGPENPSFSAIFAKALYF